MILRSRAHIDEGNAKGIGHESTLRNGTGGDACNGIDLVTIDALHGADQPRLDDGADIGECKSLAIVAIDRGMPARGPREGVIRLQLDGLDGHELFSYKTFNRFHIVGLTLIVSG